MREIFFVISPRQKLNKRHLKFQHLSQRIVKSIYNSFLHGLNVYHAYIFINFKLFKCRIINTLGSPLNLINIPIITIKNIFNIWKKSPPERNPGERKENVCVCYANEYLLTDQNNVFWFQNIAWNPTNIILINDLFYFLKKFTKHFMQIR